MLSEFPLYSNFARAATEIVELNNSELTSAAREIGALDRDGTHKLFALIQYDCLLNGIDPPRAEDARFDLAHFNPFMQNIICRFCDMHSRYQKERHER